MMRLLPSNADFDKYLSGASLWTFQALPDHLVRHFVFKDFVAAFGFMTSIALLAEQLNHHPDWSNVYDKVSIKLSTHDVGGISEKDFELASRIDLTYLNFENEK
jgi:4a-hydroxytetrahydrobiopterin dehydratase